MQSLLARSVLISRRFELMLIMCSRIVQLIKCVNMHSMCRRVVQHT
jgi:hypothetical protein